MKTKFAALFMLAFIFTAGLTFAGTAFLSDPCAHGVHLSVPIAEATAETHQLVAPVNNQAIYICGYVINSVGGTSQLEYGTSTACTGTHALTGLYAASSNVSFGGSTSTVLSAPAASTGNGVCIVAGASTTATGGEIVYVQEPLPGN
jgi:hypothetical protein